MARVACRNCQPPRHGRRAVALRWLLSAGLLLASLQALAAGPYRFEAIDRVVAIGDVHGAMPQFIASLKGAGVVDGGLGWSGGATHLVVTGDMVDRGDASRQALELLMRLQDEAAAAGGAVHVLMGNHELMTLSGDLRYVSNGDYAAFVDGATPAAPGVATSAVPGKPAGYRERLSAFAPDGALGRWLLQLPSVIVINDTAFVHGGLSSRLAGRSLEQINAATLADARSFAESWHALLDAGVLQPADDFDRILATARTLAQPPPPSQPATPPPATAGAPPPAATAADPGAGAVADPQAALRPLAQALLAATENLAFRTDGPLWYRGNALCHPYAEGPALQTLLAGLDVRRVVIGHTPTLDHRIASRIDGRVLRIDTGMNVAAYNGQPSALLIAGGQVGAFHGDGGDTVPRVESGREWQRPYDMDDAQIEAFLREAPIVHREALGDGTTHPQWLTLEQGGRRLRAVFKTLDTDPGIERGRWQSAHDSADRYQYEVAAYRLDRLLGLGMVPVAALREIDGRQGVVQYWVEDAFNESKRIAENVRFDGPCGMDAQHNLMNVFDVLTANMDRNTGNILYDRDWQLWVIDHTRAFGTGRRRPPDLRKAEIVVTAPMAEALERVTAENLAPLAPYLHRRQVDALVRRARALRESSR